MINSNRPIIQSEVFSDLTLDRVEELLKFFYDIEYVVYFMPEQKQSALGDTDLFSFKDKNCTPDKAKWLMSVSNGGDILTIPKERMKI